MCIIRFSSKTSSSPIPALLACPIQDKTPQHINTHTTVQQYKQANKRSSEEALSPTQSRFKKDVSNEVGVCDRASGSRGTYYHQSSVAVVEILPHTFAASHN
mmetsp:Transcript_32443/g.69498  ORF Transcript_32443/g.69498 Transcript_32443/m.69498 type:complete len:102 (+) Transcript_32443:145-450(+)